MERMIYVHLDLVRGSFTVIIQSYHSLQLCIAKAELIKLLSVLTDVSFCTKSRFSSLFHFTGSSDTDQETTQLAVI